MSNRTLRALAACLIAASTAALLTACGGGGSDAPSTEIAFVPMTSHGDWVVEDYVIRSGNWPVQDYVIRTESQWSELWSQSYFSMPAPVAQLVNYRPPVEFAVHTVAGVSLGVAPNGCTSLEISRVTEEPGQVQVEYRRRVQDYVGCVAAPAPLLAFVKIPATAKPVVLVETGLSPAAANAGNSGVSYDETAASVRAAGSDS